MSHHGKAVLYFALLHFGVALSVILGPGEVIPDYAILFEYMPYWVRGALWAFFGVAGFVAVRMDYRYIAFALLTVMPVQRVVGHVWSALMYIVPGAPGGSEAAFGSILVWTMVVLITKHIAGWPDISPSMEAPSQEAPRD